MCTDKENFPKLTEMNFNNNAFKENADYQFDASLRGACNRAETGVAVNAMQVAVSYPTMCSDTIANNYWYYDMTNEMDVAQCRFTWNWEISTYMVSTYAPPGPYPNEGTLPCTEEELGE